MSPCGATGHGDRTVAVIDAELRRLEMAARAVRRALTSGGTLAGDSHALQRAHVLWSTQQQLRRERAAVIARGSAGLRQLRSTVGGPSPAAA